MAKNKDAFACTECGAGHAKWVGKCNHCGAWDSLTAATADGISERDSTVQATLLKSIVPDSSRQVWQTGVEQLDRLLGGGIVDASVGLLGGAPGVGKSTLILQMVSRIGKLGKKVLYVTGEESDAQIKLRSTRLEINEDNIYLLASGDADDIIHHMQQLAVDFVVVDSIQTMSSKQFPSVQGSTVQVRECASLIHQSAKAGGPAVLLIGHITKDGLIAGPKLLEHLVDYVLYLEAVPDSPYRYLYPTKNRYGSIYETGLFKMTPKGLAEIQNVNRSFTLTDMVTMSGLAYYVAAEGSRLMMSEVQALVNEDPRQAPVRQTNGMDRARLLMILAVVQKHLNLFLGGSEVYINFSGGFKSANASVDMAVTAAILSSRLNLCFDVPTLFAGELSLTGKFSLYGGSPERLGDAAKLGFKRLVLPKAVPKEIEDALAHVESVTVGNVSDLYNLIRNCGRKTGGPAKLPPEA